MTDRERQTLAELLNAIMQIPPEHREYLAGYARAVVDMSNK